MEFTYVDTLAVEAGDRLFAVEVDSAAGRYMALVGEETLDLLYDDMMVVGEPVEMDMQEPAH